MAVEGIDFRASTCDERRGFEAYNEIYRAATSVSLTGRPFYADVSVMRTPRMVVYNRRIGGVRHLRDDKIINGDGFDHITLHIAVSGRLIGGPPGDEKRIQPGQILIADTARPYLNQMDDAQVCSVQLAREHVREVVPNIDRIHGAVLPDETAGLLTDFLMSFTRRAATLPAHIADHGAGTAVELLGQATSGARSSLSKDADAALRRTRAEAFISSRLADPHLDAGAIAVGVETSRSALYRTFEADGGIARYVQQRRLDGLRKALLHSHGDRSLASFIQTYGFASESHCNRAFAAAFGKPPKRYRDEVRRARMPGAPDSQASIIMRWATELY